MKDHNLVTETGQHVPVSRMSTADIEECLRGGVEIVATDGEEPRVENVLERLRLELLIRSMGL